MAAASSVTPTTAGQFLIGSRNAIQRLLQCRSTIWIGLLFVVSAGFAREYDGESLLHEPWHLLIPLAASLVSCLLLFSLLALVCRLGGSFSGSFWQGYCSFLGLYWMTAPMAWLYAFPVERFFTPAIAVRANLTLLAMVSLWRVVLMTRVVSVVFKCNLSAALVLVMLFADTFALSILYLTPTPIFDMMGGIRLTESEEIIQSAHFLVGGGGILTAPIWVIGGLIIVIKSVSGKKPVCSWQTESSAEVRPGKLMWLAAAGSVAFGAALLPFAQPEQYNRWQVKHAFQNGRVDDGIRYMASRRRSDFPPHWDPPPRVGYGKHEPPLIEILDQIELTGTKGWVRDIFVDKLRFQAGRDYSNFFGFQFQLADMSDEQLGRYVAMLESLPDGDMIAWSHDRELRRQVDKEREKSSSRRQLLIQRLQVMRDRYEVERKSEQGNVPLATLSRLSVPLATV